MNGLNRAAVAAVMALAGVTPLPLGAQTTPVKPADARWTRAAVAFVNALNGGDFVAASRMAAPSVAEYFTPEKMKPIWSQISSGMKLGSVTGESVVHTGGYNVVDLTVTLGAQTGRIRVALDSLEKVSGVFRLPESQPPVPPPYAPPTYVDTTTFEDWPMQLNAGEFHLPAKLTLPKDLKNVPLVVLVHGSGPNDMDEAIGPNRPFRDLAWGLASQGIAVLRYDKRTKVAGAKVGNSITVDEEVILDAITALDSGRVNPNIDAKRAFVLGHSLGAMLAPEIAARDGKLAGVLLLAGTPRKLAPVMMDQFAYLKKLPANSSAEAQGMIGDLEVQLDRLIRREPKPDEPVMGAPASYFYDLDLRDGMKFAQSIRIPMLFLQGGRDYQVLPLDLDLWQAGLKGHQNASFKLYPDLNHLFMTGTGKATPTEYSLPGHVSEDVISDIVRFVSRAR